MTRWLARLRHDPLPNLLSSGSERLEFFTRRDLLDELVGSEEVLWELPSVQRLIRKQQANGAWRYRGKNREVYPEINYDLLETFRSLGQLVEQHAFHRGHHAIERAAEYVFSCQAEEGDIRGILGTQYMPYYHAVIVELLIKAGYASDARIERGMEWLLTMHQDDGGWLIPMQAVPARQKTREVWSAAPVPLDRSMPFSHQATGMVLRAFAVHPSRSKSEQVRVAAARLKARFFQADRYNDRKAPRYWTKFQFPFWWSNLLTALDTLSLIGFSPEDPDVRRGLDWFVANQGDNGLWKTSYEQAGRRELSAKELGAKLWVSLAVCRVFKRFYG